MLYLLLGLSALTIILNLVASLIKSIAESTLRHGGDALTAAGGKLSVIGGHMMGHMRKGTNAFTNSIKKRADSVLSNNSASPTKGSHHEVSPQCSTPSTELENDLDPPNSVDHTLYIVTEEEGKIARCDTPGEDGIDDSGSPKIISGYSLLKTNSPEKSASTVRLNGSIENTSSVVDKDDHSVTSNGTDREVDNTNASSSTLGSHSPGKSNHVTVAEDIQSRPETACSTSKSVSRNNENCSTPSLSNIKIHQQRSFSSDAVNNNLPDAID